MDAITVIMDIFIAGPPSYDSVCHTAAALSQPGIQPHAISAFEAVGTLLHAPALTVDRAVLALDSNEVALHTGWAQPIFWRKNELPPYLRKSSACVRSFLLLAALMGVQYDEEQIAEVVCQMLQSSNMAQCFPVTKSELRMLLTVLEPRTRVFIEDITHCNMRILSMISNVSSGDQDDTHAASSQLPPNTMGKLLVHASQAIREGTSEKSVELCGSTGFFDLATILLWLAPEKIVISLRRSNAHPTDRLMDYGDTGRPLLIQYGGGAVNCGAKGQPASDWKKVPWSSGKALAIDALGWAAVANPLLRGSAGVFSGVAITAARKWFG